MIPHNKPSISKREEESVMRVLRSGHIAQGKEVEEFEDSLCSYLGHKSGHGVAFSSGTAALYVALLCAGVQRGDKIITSTYVCSSVLNAIYFIGAKVILVDIDPVHFNISFEAVKEKIDSATKAIIVPHIFGMPADIDKFIGLDIPIIEDCAQGIGAKLNDRQVGTFGAITVFSFYATKLLTTGHGGMVVSKDNKIIDKLKDYREFDCRKDYRPRFNFQMSDFQAAMGKIQLERLPSFLEKRKDIAGEYYKILPKDVAWPPKDIKNREPNFYRFLIRDNNPRKLQGFLKEKGIKTIIPIENYELLHRYLKQDSKDFPISEEVANSTLSLPIYPSLTSSEIEKIKEAIREIYV